MDNVQKYSICIKTDLRETGWGKGVDWIHLAQDRNQWRVLVNTVMYFWILYNVGNFLIN
jgi:hypothetical protein